MKYTKELAEQVAKIHETPTPTLKTWEFRGAIPKKYFDTAGGIVQPFGAKITDADKYRLLEVFKLPNLNFSEVKSISVQKLSDLERGKGVVYQSDYKAFKKELTDLKNKSIPVQTAKSYETKVKALRVFLKDPRLKPFTFAEGREHLYCIEQLTTKKTDPDVLLVEQTIINVSLFLQSVIL
jgi:hypothetical protein